MASKRRLRRKRCERKVRHETQAIAIAEAMRLRRRHGLSERISAYGCQYCGGWHVGHLPSRIVAAIDRRYEG